MFLPVFAASQLMAPNAVADKCLAPLTDAVCSHSVSFHYDPSSMTCQVAGPRTGPCDESVLSPLFNSMPECMDTCKALRPAQPNLSQFIQGTNLDALTCSNTPCYQGDTCKDSQYTRACFAAPVFTIDSSVFNSIAGP